MRYSALKIFTEALTGNKGWKPVWRDPDPKPEYDVVIVGGRGPKSRGRDWDEKRENRGVPFLQPYNSVSDSATVVLPLGRDGS